MEQVLQGISPNFKFSETEVKGVKEYTISGYISTSSLDLADDVVTKSCMEDMVVQIKAGSVMLDFEHETIHNENLDINPFGRITDAKMDRKGLWVKAVLNSSNARFKEIWGSIKGGFLRAFSIAFKPLEAVTEYIEGKAARVLNKLKLINVGLTGTPINEDCSMDSVFVKAAKGLIAAEVKAKYIKRTGSSGKYKYTYKQEANKKVDTGSEEGENIIEAIGDIERGTSGSFDDLDTFEKETLIDIYTEAGADEAKVQKLRDAGIYLRNDEKLAKEAGEKYKTQAEKEIYIDEMEKSGDKEKAEKAVETHNEDKQIEKDRVKEELIKQKVALEKEEKELKKMSKEDIIKKFMAEKKALTTTSFPVAKPDESQSTPNGDDKSIMAEEQTTPAEAAPQAPVETQPEATPEAPATAPAEAPAEESAEVTSLKADVKALTAVVAKLQAAMAKPDMKATLQAAPQEQLNNNAPTPLECIQ